jgi:cellulose synthase/poly-beta-1,6-N-acetylglucosamine synthase-like glycosyltransferase
MEFHIDQAGVVGIVLFILLMLSLLIYWGYYLFVFTRLAFYNPPKSLNKVQPVSIIICAKNELENLQKNLPLIMAQEYPEFEVIVVNDHSFDESLLFLKEFAKLHSNFKVINLDEEEIILSGKKFAQTLGIKGAKYELLVFTDADCTPVSNKWLSTMQSNYSDKVELVLGYGAYEKRPGLLNQLIRFDTFQIALQYFSYSLIGMPYMGVGRNLSYRRTVFFRNKGFGSHNHIRSGDDDLFVNEVANNQNTLIEVRPESHTISVPKKTWSDWFRQKRRHMTTGGLYKASHKFWLGWFYSAQMFSWLCFILLFALQYNWQWILIILFLKMLVQWIIWWKTSKWLGQKDLLLLSPLLELLMVFFNLFFSVTNLFAKEPQWK